MSTQFSSSTTLIVLSILAVFFLVVPAMATNQTCVSDTECNDNNSLTFDECINPATAVSECRNTPINCAAATDCGNSGFVGSPFCSEKDVMQNVRNFTCNNAGTLNSFCTSTVTSHSVQACELACSQGGCVRCIQNSDCGSDSFVGAPFCSMNNITRNFQSYYCLNPATLQSSCTTQISNHTLEICSNACTPYACVRCITDADCADNNASTRDTCGNPATPQSFCNNTVSTIKIEILIPQENQVFLNASPIPLQYIITGPISSCSYVLDALPAALLPSCQNSTFMASVGAHTLTLYGSTPQNQTTSDSVHFSVAPNQTTTLTLQIISPQNRTYTTQRIPITILSNGAEVFYSLDGGTNESYNGSITRVFSLGSHTLTAYARDPAGNQLTERVTFLVKRQNRGSGSSFGHDFIPTTSNSSDRVLFVQTSLPHTSDFQSRDTAPQVLNANAYVRDFSTSANLAIIFGILIIILACIIAAFYLSN